ncbi:MAG TPA: alpha-glucuronidase family glycosyl hydrolase, partial [Terracidiphilus sp.]|nr:alpha-glucuronidase family glycosyl hydrolase [Terracidiphilus sp.]
MLSFTRRVQQMVRPHVMWVLFSAAGLAFSLHAGAQENDPAWLGYRSVKNPRGVPVRIRRLGDSVLEQTAAKELSQGISGLFGTFDPHVGKNLIILGTPKELEALNEFQVPIPKPLGPEDFDIFWYGRESGGQGSPRNLYIVGGSPRGVLYGAFTLLRDLAEGTDLTHAAIREHPAMPIRWVDDWDNLDGSIERGYAGRSIFFENG